MIDIKNTEEGLLCFFMHTGTQKIEHFFVFGLKTSKIMFIIENVTNN